MATLVLGTGALLGQSSNEAPPQSISLGPLWLRPSGFFESTGVIRSTTTPDDMSTRFGNIPLDHGESQTLDSLRNSRIALLGKTAVGGGASISGFMEADFLSRDPADPYRWRQYWGKFEYDGWEVLAGRAWSFLRPNRASIITESQLLNTRVADAGYQVGLLGYRVRQIRVVRHLGDWHLGLSYENGKTFLPKVARDTKLLHLEVTGVAGAGGYKGLSVASVIHASKKLDIVTQQFGSRGGGPDALATVPAGVRMFSTLEGVEMKVGRGLQFFGYGGLVYGAQSAGNRTVREGTIGFSQDLFHAHHFGWSVLTVQFSRVDRSTWGGRYGLQNLTMISVRHYVGAQ